MEGPAGLPTMIDKVGEVRVGELGRKKAKRWLSPAERLASHGFDKEVSVIRIDPREMMDHSLRESIIPSSVNNGFIKSLKEGASSLGEIWATLINLEKQVGSDELVETLKVFIAFCNTASSVRAIQDRVEVFGK